LYLKTNNTLEKKEKILLDLLIPVGEKEEGREDTKSAFSLSACCKSILNPTLPCFLGIYIITSELLSENEDVVVDARKEVDFTELFKLDLVFAFGI
jgi:hypothetical protein